ncbi:hypothetical protein B0T25DRAFT_363282 [Lasiosphaeria hispida]|uniref:PD-(D/E)XK nuclease-like domain-containing protein n=1 Tax=Lasiosphaeria hispida TaxID=260671 RepID=A0AAJ0H5P2_9PEZI|nr:hypothetical protein B0T25DRAFT_363282 [Lasiosphaeria hispida]
MFEVLSWLDAVPLDGQALSEQFLDKQPLDEPSFDEPSLDEQPPVEMANRSGSPSKRPRVDDEDDEGFPMANRPNALSPALSRLSGPTTATSPSCRSRSPTKRVLDLLSFSKPVTYQLLGSPVHLPASIKGLASTINKKAAYALGIFPSSIKGDIVAAINDDETPPNDCFTDGSAAEQMRAEMAQLREVLAASERSTYWNRSEAAWNLLVHWPMLKIALSSLDNVSAELVTAAQILTPFVPEICASGSTTTKVPMLAQSKIVDFVLVLQPRFETTKPPSYALVQDLPLNEQTLNQTDYGPLQYFPAPVPIETKTTRGDLEEAKVQLGVWVAAWFRRMRLLPRHTDEAKATIAVPMITVDASRWAVYYACERDDSIAIYGPLDIGDTLTVMGIYKLLACLKAIGQWVGEEFKGWFEQNICRV